MEHKIVGDDCEPRAKVQKNFWSYIKVTNKGRVGTPPLKDNGILNSDSKCKSEILNRRYQSVFSEEESSTVLTLTEPPSPTMPEIVVTQDGVKKLLLDLKENKGSSPDSIPS